jgi:hypothetical protein
MAADLYIAPRKQQAGELLKRIRSAARAGLPSHARVEVEDLVAWTREASDALYERHVPAHSLPAKLGTTDVLIHLRSGDIRPMDAIGLMDIAGSLAATYRRGMDLDSGLRHSPRAGVFLPNVVVDDQWIPTCSTDVGGADMPRTTPEELDAWWKELGPFPRL